MAVIIECKKVHNVDQDKAHYLNEKGWSAFHSPLFAELHINWDKLQKLAVAARDEEMLAVVA